MAQSLNNMNEILVIREDRTAEAFHLKGLLKKRGHDRKARDVFGKPWVAGLASKGRKLKTWPGK